MRRAAAILTLALALLGAASASGASGPVFTIVGETPAQPALPSAEVPNAEGSVLLPPGWTVSTLTARRLSFQELSALWHRAGAAYGIPWQVLAAINKIESNFGRNMGPSSAGAVGWMQFMPSTWLRWGTDANGDGVADPWAPEDAIFSAARYLAAAGGRTDLYRGVFAYNHADWYVRDVLELAQLYGNGGGVLAFTLDRLQVELDAARKKVAKANRRLVRAAERARAHRRAERSLLARAERSRLLSTRLALERRAVQAGVRAHAAGEVVAVRRELAPLVGDMKRIARLSQGRSRSRVVRAAGRRAARNRLLRRGLRLPRRRRPLGRLGWRVPPRLPGRRHRGSDGQPALRARGRDRRGCLATRVRQLRHRLDVRNSRRPDVDVLPPLVPRADRPAWRGARRRRAGWPRRLDRPLDRPASPPSDRA